MMRVTSAVLLLSMLFACGDDETAPTSTNASSTSTGGGGGSGGAGGSPPEDITLTTYVGTEPANVLFVAAQDGDGAWEPLTGASGVYSFTSVSGRFGIAYVCEELSTSLTPVRVVQATTSDFTALVRMCEGAPPSNTVTVSGTVTTLGVNNTVSIMMSPYAVAANITGTYQLQVPPGTWDMFAVHDTGGADSVSDRIIVRRDVAVGSAGITQNFDFTQEGAEMPLIPLTISNTTSMDTVVINSFLRPQDGGGMMLNAPNPNFAAVPSSMLEGDDTHLVNCFISNPMSGLRTAASHAKSPPPSGMMFTLLDPMVASVSVASSDPVQLSGSLGPVARAHSYHLSIGQTAAARRLFIDLSSAWLGTGAMLEYTTPDLSSLAGWDPNWELMTGEVTDWFASARVSTGRAVFDDDPTPGVDPQYEGVITRSTIRGGQVTP